MGLRHYRKTLALYALAALVIAASCLGKNYRSTGNDFKAYYAAAHRVTHGLNPYVAADVVPFKYGPPSLVALWPFGIFPFDVARWVWVIFHLAVTLSLPALLYAILRAPLAARRMKLDDTTLCAALALSLVGSLRFIDNEFSAVQVNLVTAALFVLGLRCFVGPRPSRLKNAFACFVWAVAAFFKFHPLLSFVLFWGASVGWVTGVVALVALLPWPALWGDWLRQMQNTGGDIVFSPGTSTITQGFFPLSVNLTGGSHSYISLVALALFTPVALWFAWRVPKFNFARAGQGPHDHPLAFALAMAALLTVASTVSKIPWQHTYSVLWPFIGLAYVCGNQSERRAVAIIALALGLSARAVIGASLANFLEGWVEIVMWLALALAVVMLRQSRRYYGRAKN